MKTEDVTGRMRQARNVGASYVGHFVFIVFGFILPRAIDAHMGQAALGIWDFSWSFVHYLSLAMIGIGSSVNRYVARYRAANDALALNRMLSTVVALQICIALMVLGISIGLSLFVPGAFSQQLGADREAAGWVIAFLGASLAVQMAFDAWRGVLSGCHRWDYYNAINAGGYAVTAIAMILVLVVGGGLREIAAVYMGVTLGTELLRWRVTRRVCPELDLKWNFINIQDARKAARFGVKTILLGLPGILVIQTVSVFLVAHSGPAALAVLARPLSLVRQISTLANKYSFVLTPMAGSLQSQNKVAELRQFALQAARAGWLIAIPPLAFLFVLGDAVLELWMGHGYAHWGTTALLATGYLLPISQSPVLRIMVGLDAHGRIAKWSIALSAVVLIIGLATASTFGWSVPFAAGLIGISMILSIGVSVLVYGFAHLRIGVRQYYEHVLKDGLILLVSLLLALYLARHYLPDSAMLHVIFGALLTTAIVTVLQKRDIVKFYRSMRDMQTDAAD